MNFGWPWTNNSTWLQYVSSNICLASSHDSFHAFDVQVFLYICKYVYIYLYICVIYIYIYIYIFLCLQVWEMWLTCFCWHVARNTWNFGIEIGGKCSWTHAPVFFCTWTQINRAFAPKKYTNTQCVCTHLLRGGGESGRRVRSGRAAHQRGVNDRPGSGGTQNLHGGRSGRTSNLGGSGICMPVETGAGWNLGAGEICGGVESGAGWNLGRVETCDGVKSGAKWNLARGKICDGVKSAAGWNLGRGDIWGGVTSGAGWNLGRSEIWGGVKSAQKKSD